jgi:hypothetical protein
MKYSRACYFYLQEVTRYSLNVYKTGKKKYCLLNSEKDLKAMMVALSMVHKASVNTWCPLFNSSTRAAHTTTCTWSNNCYFYLQEVTRYSLNVYKTGKKKYCLLNSEKDLKAMMVALSMVHKASVNTWCPLFNSSTRAAHTTTCTWSNNCWCVKLRV